MYIQEEGGRAEKVCNDSEKMDRLKSDCSATSSTIALLMVHCLPYLPPWPFAMAMPEYPYPCMKPLKHESIPETTETRIIRFKRYAKCTH